MQVRPTVVEPEITDLGPRPKAKYKRDCSFLQSRCVFKSQQMVMWWLDRMAVSDHGLTERDDLVLAWTLGDIGSET